MELRETILEGTLQAFRQKGLRFTMDDVAKLLGMSKKTIYTVFRDKTGLISDMVDYGFDAVKAAEHQILTDDRLSTLEKVRAILGVLPEGYQNIDLRQLSALKDKYPKAYRKVENRLETGWEETISLLETGMAEGCIRPIRIPVLKTMLEATIEQFFRRDVLAVNQISYQDALDEVVEILVSGIAARPEGGEKPCEST